MAVQGDEGVATGSGGQGDETGAPADIRTSGPGHDLGPGGGPTRPSELVSGHIAGLDGLRALAVGAVLVFHLWPLGLPGGFIGVDVFFVISGFLITTLLLREHDREGRVDLTGFWVRRARRLLPALVLVVAASILGAWLVSSDLLVGIERQTIGALTFSSNWLEIGAGQDYFAATAPTLLVTFWSLAVEEQFYLIWPLALLGILQLARTMASRLTVALVIGGASALLMAVRYQPGGNPSRVYYGTDTHLFGLMIGVALAFAFSGDARILASEGWARARQWVGLGCFAGLLVLIATLDGASTITYRGGLVLTSLLAAGMIASLPGAPNAFTRVNELAPVEWIGQRSYGIYLWHWPVILLVSELLPATAPGEPPSLLVVVVSLALTFGLAALSYVYVEMPIRRQGFGAAWAVTGRPAVAGASLVVLGLLAIALTTAPEASEAELAVARGQAAIEAQRPVPVSTAPQPGAEPGAEGAGAAPAWPEDQPVPAGELITGYGDSVLSGAAPAMFERFDGIAIDAEPNRQWPAAPGLVRGALDAGILRPVVVLSFGTNAGLNSDASQDALRETLEILGPDRRVVLVNTVGTSSWIPDTNEKLEQIAAEHDNVIVADWNSVVAADPSLLHSDRTHPNMEGIGVYADLVASSLEELGPR
jgi:peptidoglycan/LPS O-acetylase OafA/YrhL